ncbi:MAG: tonB dependent receptor family protein [Sphingomonas bacterium]|nr:tonB dependent receptor family protein [Sphingomonas bacterium]
MTEIVRRSVRVGAALSVAMGALVFSTAAMAQGVSGQDGGKTAGKVEAEKTDATESGDIVVTAQKREESLQNVPISISVVSGQDLQQRGASSLADYAAYLPGVQISNATGQPGRSTVVLRGVNSLTSSATVGIYLDDSPITASGLYNRSAGFTLDLLPYDIQRVEVLRGPQGTVYGANTLGGLLKYVTVEPNLQDYSGRAGAEVFGISHASEIGYQFGGMVNAPLITDTLGMTASFAYRKTPGFVDNVSTGAKDFNSSTQKGGRISLLWRPADGLSVKLSTLWQRTESAGSSGIQITTSGAALAPGAGYFSNNTRTPETFTSDYQYWSAAVDYDAGFATFTSATSYSKAQILDISDQSPALGVYFPLISGLLGLPTIPAGNASFRSDLGQKKFTQEIRLTSPSNDRFEWLIGGFYTNEDNSHLQVVRPLTLANVLIPQLNPFVTATLPNTYKEYAVFGNATYKFGEIFDLTGGLRWARNEQAFRQTLLAIHPALGAPQDFPGRSSESVLTWSVSPQLHLSKDTMLYARVAKGYRPGGPNAAIPGTTLPLSVHSDTVISYEAGVKTRTLNNTLSFDAAAFRTDWQDIQVSVRIGSFSGIDNGKSARSQGFEANLTYEPVPGLLLNANGAYTDSKCIEASPQCGAGARLGSVPDFSGSFNADYSARLSDAIEGRIGASIRYTGERLSAVSSNAQSISIPSYTLLDLNGGVTIADKWTVRAYVRNVTDSRANQSRSISTTLPGIISITPVQPRTIGAALDLAF